LSSSDYITGSEDILRTDTAAQLSIDPSGIQGLAVNVTKSTTSGADDDATVPSFTWTVSFMAASSLVATGEPTVAAWAGEVKTSLQSSDLAVQLAADLGVNVVTTGAVSVPAYNPRLTTTAAPTVSTMPTVQPTWMPSVAPSVMVSPAPTSADYATIDVAMYLFASEPVNYDRLQALKNVTESTIAVSSLVLKGFSFMTMDMGDTSSFYQWMPNAMGDGNLTFFTVCLYLLYMFELLYEGLF